METRMTEQRRAEIKTHIEGQLAVDCCCCAFGDELLSELEAVEAMFRLKQDDWIEACREVDQLREIAKKLVGALEFYNDEQEWIDFMATAFSPRLQKRVRVDSHFDGDKGKNARLALEETAEARKALNL